MTVNGTKLPVRAKDTLVGHEIPINPRWRPFDWDEYREYPWSVVREEQATCHAGAAETAHYLNEAADRRAGPRFPHMDWLYKLCRSEIENWKISLMDPAFRDDWHWVLGVQCEIADLEEKAEILRKLMWEWRKRHGITETWE
jgi:hypothetical protein